MMDDERDDDEGTGLPSDVVDAAMCVTEADFERILGECDRDPFKEFFTRSTT
jgi:hypothetical protein